jgi:hypothetical protein
MQFEPATFAQYAVDGDHDGQLSLATALTAQATPQAQDRERAAGHVAVHQQPAQAHRSRMKAGWTVDLCPPTGGADRRMPPAGQDGAGRLVLSRKGSRRDELQPPAWPGIPRDAVAGIGTRWLGRRARHPA